MGMCVCIYGCACARATGDAGFHAQGAGSNAQFKHQLAQFWRQQAQEIERVSGMSTHVLTCAFVSLFLYQVFQCMCVYTSALLLVTHEN